MLEDLKKQLKSLIEISLSPLFPSGSSLPEVELEIPADKANGEFSANIALKSAKIFKKNPIDCANEFQKVLEKRIQDTPLKNKIAKIEVKKPGFINFYISLEASYDVIYRVLQDQNYYGRSNFGQNKKFQVEFVSANPTGPLSVAHGRQAAVGDALGNILNYLGFQAVKEFYVNDEGNQINILGRSVEQRAHEILGNKVEFAEYNYQGEYIKDMAAEFLQKQGIKTAAALSKVDPVIIREWAANYLLDIIKKELADFRVNFNVWAHQSQIATNANIEIVLKELAGKGFLYEHEGALWLRSTTFGDDKDRVVRKSDGSYTYLTPDIVYHKNKFERGFVRVVNMWGPDHHGYIPRIKASVQALGYDPKALDVVIVQLATIYRNGQPVSMSTRRGQYISLREVMDEVGVDAGRFFFLMRGVDAHLDFDLDLAKKQSSENPVYYIQYAHARVHSINQKATEAKIKMKESGFSHLKEEEELALIKKMGGFPGILLVCYNNLDPYPLVTYLHELAIAFHKFYDKHRVIDTDADLSAERLALVNAVRIVLSNGLKLLGLTAPDKM